MKRLATSLSISRLASRLALGALGLMLALGACLIDERKYDQQLASCTDYCTQVEAKCIEPYKVYDRDGACMAVCMQMELGDTFGGVDGNTVACRLDRLGQQDFEAATHCAQVGPGGNGACGSNCDALCTLRRQACGPIEGQSTMLDIVNEDICQHNCRALPDLGNLNTTRDRTGDSVQCRLVHVAESMISHGLAVEHCYHTQTIPFPGESVPCSDDETLTKEQDCQKYCGLAMGACENEVAVYESLPQCMSVCRLLDQGLKGDQSADSVRCRRYHSYAALGDRLEHCTHTGPTGDGHCGGGNCPDYCKIAKEACPTAFSAQFVAGDLAECEERCASLDGAPPNGFRDRAQRYTVHPPPVGNTLLCRTYHAIAALTSPSLTECAAAFGGAPCQ
jgi:hypothetical protein